MSSHGPKITIALGAGDGLENIPGIGLQGAFVQAAIEILAQTRRRPEFVRPLDPIFDVDAGARLNHIIVAHSEAHHPASGGRCRRQ